MKTRRLQLPLARQGARWGAFIAVAALLTAAQPAVAQRSADRALAESLFQEGRVFMEAGNPESACPKFAESQRLEAAVGTSLNLATCYEALDRTASAWAEFASALALAERDGDTERAALAEGRIRALGERLSRIVVTPPPLADVHIAVDGRELQQGAWGTPLPLDPGPHEVLVSAVGYQTWSAQIDLPKGPAELRVDVPMLQPQATTPQPQTQPPMQPPVDAPPKAPNPVEAQSSDGVSGRSIGLWTALGVSASALVVGGIATFDFYDQKAMIRTHCDGRYCDDVGLEADKQMRTSAWIADASYGVAALAGLVAGYLWFTEPDTAKTGMGFSTVVGGAPGVSLDARF